ncbi:hypothetical protein [Pedobacter psychrotolerans]|nr:hypothetical protein [Pedobacter psychrotolerans]
MKKRQNKLKIFLCSVLCLISMSSCKSDRITPVLERGKPVDLAQVDFQKLNPDNFFAKLAYVKENKMGANKHTNSRNEVLSIEWFTLYNITDQRLLNQYKDVENYIIKKGEMYGDLDFVERKSPLIGMKDPDLRSFGYWTSKEIMFSRLYMSSTPANKLIRVILETNNLHNSGEKEYNTLLEVLKKQNKKAKIKMDPQSNGIPSYSWTTEEKVIQLYFSKADDLNSFTLKIAYINPDTKGYLKEFGN